MKVAHLARKPLSEGSVSRNALVHGTGGINIEASRVRTDDDLNGGTYAPRGSDRPEGYANWRFKRGDKGNAGAFCQPRGRWPANLVLLHLPGCRCVGTKKVHCHPVILRAETVPISYHSRMTRKPGTRLDHGDPNDPDGLETVDAWECVEGCPVKELDGQSGDRRSAGIYPSSAAGDGRAWLSTGLTQGRLYGDSGGASRFFKQVKP